MVASLVPGSMVETPTAGPEEAFGVLDVALGVAPFVLLVGVLTGLAAGAAVWPIAARLSDGRVPLERDPSSYLRGPAVVGGVGLLASVVVLDVALGDPPERVGSVLAGRSLLVAGCLSAVAHHVQYREARPERRRANAYTYVAFVVVWTAFALGLSALWI